MNSHRVNRALIFFVLVSSFFVNSVAAASSPLLEKPNRSRRVYHVLSLDGGMKGLLQTKFLQELEETTGKKTADLFDLIVGTSTGGLNALAASLGIPAKEISMLYVEHGEKMFHKRASSLSGMAGPRYSGQSFSTLIKTLLPEGRQLSEVQKSVVVTSFDMDKRKPVLFSSDAARANPQDDLELTKVAQASCAAPTYFSPVQILRDGKPPLRLIDGALFATNPSLVALIEARKKFGQDADIRVVSVGTGKSEVKSLSDNMGTLEWAKRIPGLFLASNIASADYQTRALLEGRDDVTRYWRFNPSVPNISPGHTNPKIARILQATIKNLAKTNAFQSLVQELNQSPLPCACETINSRSDRKIHYILSLSGGGMKGSLQARLLQEFEKETGRKATDLFDLIVGTSAGGLNALALSTGMPAEYLTRTYIQDSQKMFQKRTFSLAGLTGPKYDSSLFEEQLQRLLPGGLRLSDIQKSVHITSFGLDERNPVLFSSDTARDAPENDWKIVDIARATSAAPTYFAPALIHRKGKPHLRLVDGALFATNPSLVALIEARKKFGQRADIRIVSVGTGKSEHTPLDKNMGIIEWAKRLPGLFLASNIASADYQTRALLEKYDGVTRYWSFNPRIPKTALDCTDAKTVDILQAAGEEMTKTAAFQNLVQELKRADRTTTIAPHTRLEKNLSALSPANKHIAAGLKTRALQALVQKLSEQKGIIVPRMYSNNVIYTPTIRFSLSEKAPVHDVHSLGQRHHHLPLMTSFKTYSHNSAVKTLRFATSLRTVGKRTIKTHNTQPLVEKLSQRAMPIAIHVCSKKVGYTQTNTPPKATAAPESPSEKTTPSVHKSLAFELIQLSGLSTPHAGFNAYWSKHLVTAP